MATIDQSRGDCFVFTFKEGLLSPVAHDLRLKVGRWSMTWDPASRTVEARFDAASLVVDSVMRDGQPAPGVLDEKDKGKIAKNLRDDVLETGRYAEVKFRAKAIGAVPGAVQGELDLHGKVRPVTVQVRVDGAQWVAEATLHQPDWGVKPFSAMLGTLKVKPDVKVRVSVPTTVVENA